MNEFKLYVKGTQKSFKTDSVFGEYFLGEVSLLKNGLLRPLYLLPNGAVISVPNNRHIRLVPNAFNLPSSFEILTPLFTVKVKSGEIPSSNIVYKNCSYYIDKWNYYYRR